MEETFTVTESSPPRRTLLLTKVRRVVYLVISLYVGLCLLLMWSENSMLYPAPRTAVGPWTERTALGAEDVELAAADGTKLHAWYLPHCDPKRVMLLAHGNGENVAMAAHEAAWLRDRFDASVLVFDYRGYGKSEGAPSEEGLYQDGEAALWWLAKRAGVQPSEIYLVGRSLGTGVMVEIGVKHQAKGLILLCPFAEMPDAAARRFWFVPVRLLMRNRYPSVKKIPQFKGATFVAHGDCDDLVPQWTGKRLFDAAPQPKEWVSLRGAGHNNIDLSQCEVELRGFLEKLK
jgi:uncharacterized protein